MGSDENGDGTESKPFKTILQAMRHAGQEPFPEIHQDSKEDGKKYEIASKSQLKKIQKIWIREKYNNKEKQRKLQEDEEKRIKNLEESKSIVIEEDKSLPAATLIKIHNIQQYKEQRIRIFGWVHRLRRQGIY
jgi:asparaginyl-tRNA synthetase